METFFGECGEQIRGKMTLAWSLEVGGSPSVNFSCFPKRFCKQTKRVFFFMFLGVRSTPKNTF